VFSSCKNENIVSSESKKNTPTDDVEYPTYTIDEYEKMDKYEINKTIDNIKYKYIYYFKEDMCVNSKEELTFNSNDKANSFYTENKDSEEYMNITIKNNLVIYIYNPEYFEYLMYPKDVLIELLNTSENSE
jgi:hypothetical protein